MRAVDAGGATAPYTSVSSPTSMSSPPLLHMAHVVYDADSAWCDAQQPQRDLQSNASHIIWQCRGRVRSVRTEAGSSFCHYCCCCPIPTGPCT